MVFNQDLNAKNKGTWVAHWVKNLTLGLGSGQVMISQTVGLEPHRKPHPPNPVAGSRLSRESA